MHLPTIPHSPGPWLSRHFLPYQVNWILNDARLLLAEKSVRIGWTYADAYKNVRKRLEHPRRDYLFATKDYPTALEYVQTCHKFCEVFDFARFVQSRREASLRVPVFDAERATPFTDEVKAGIITFKNGSRIIAFSSNPNALRAYGGDVGLDEFAFHPAAAELWAAASGRVTWGYDLAIWSSHSGPDSLFARFVREARTGMGRWSYYRVTLPDAIEMGLVEKIAQATGNLLTREGFLEECRARARFPEVFEQEYLCNASGGGVTIVPWEAIEKCQTDDPIERCHWEAAQVLERFGEYHPSRARERHRRIVETLEHEFRQTFANRRDRHRLGFDVAASGRGSLSVIYVDRVVGQELRLAALLTCRTEDWHFLKSALTVFLRRLPSVRGCGDETGLGRQICWEIAKECPWAFKAVNFSQEKTALGFELMNQLALGRKRFPRAAADVAADYFALHKTNAAGRWSFSEGHNPLNAASHCDIAWAGALASRAHAQAGSGVVAMVVY